MKRHSPQRKQSSHARRRGALFHYYMMYLFLSSILLTTSGLCIHTILKADLLDSKAAIYLRTLLRMDEHLRRDVADSVSAVSEPANLALNIKASERKIRWSIKDNVAKRETIENMDAVSSERYVFPRGTQLHFYTDEQKIVLTILEPSVTHVPKDPTVSLPNAKTVQIVTVLSATGDES